ncbi:MAG: ComF family protein [Halothece sp. Uz-M2-17]|nr:ComF family protein [Halothece sp. Uz-M2-17]
MLNWSQLSQEILSLFLHPNCPLCGRSAEQVVCKNCERQLQQCRLSQSQFQGKGGISVFAWGKYEGLLKRAIAQLKYEQQAQLARPLGLYLGQTWLTLASGRLNPLVVPIPLHPAKQKQRGYNQAELIARSFCTVTGLPLQAHGLKRVKNTDALFGLNPKEREKAVAKAFQVGKGLKAQQSVILIDDIYTTGTTVNTAHMTLQQAGMKVIAVGAIAASQVESRADI